MNASVDERVQDFAKSLSQEDQGRIGRYIDHFNKYGFSLPSKYFKKIDSNLWELRPGSIRLLLGWTANKKQIVIAHIFKKKTQTTPLKEIETANKRLKSYS